MPSLVIDQIFNAQPEFLYDAWTQSQTLDQWFFPKQSWSCYSLIDLRVAGNIHVELTNTDGLVHTFKGRYLQLVPPEIIAFSWTSLVVESSVVRIQLVPELDQTRLTLSHDGLGDSDAIQHHIRGWAGCLDQLEIYCDTFNRTTGV